MHPLSKKIGSLQRRLVLRQHAVAACWIAVTLIAAALLLGMTDYFVRFRDPGLRIMATAALVAAVLWAVHRWWYSPHRQRLVPLAVARRVETRFPQLNDSLTSALEFLKQSEDDRTAGSAQLRRLVVAEAANAVEGLPLDDVIDRRPLRRAMAWLAVAGIAVALCLAWDAAAVGTALARLAAPLGSTDWPRQHRLAFRNPPTRLAAGQTFEAELIDTAGELPDEVHIQYRLAHRQRRETTSEPMIRSGDAMVARRENVRQSFAFRAEGGDDDTMRWHWVEVVEPPQIESLAITVHPPSYTGMPAAPSERHLEVLAGTGIEVNGTANAPLRSARILQDDSAPIVASITSDVAGNQRRAFRIPPRAWVATTSGRYSLELTDAEGTTGVVGRWNLRVDADSPPSVSWQRPNDDLYVTAAAVAPIELIVKDNLAVQRVDLVYDHSDWSESERERMSAGSRIALYRGPETPAAQSRDANGSQGESRVIEYAWNLAPLKLPVGAELSMMAEASDYRPGVGRTAGPRRITIISNEDLEARLADRLAQIVRLLERALAIEQATRQDLRRLEIQMQGAGALRSGDRNALQSVELNQRRVERMLVDPAEGIPAIVDALLTDIEMNRMTSAEARETIERLRADLERLASGPLNIAERELTAARKTTEALAERPHNAADEKQLTIAPAQAEKLLASFTAAGQAQDDVIATLERLVNDLSSKSDYRRFARLLAELRQDQIAHEEAARAEIGVEMLPLRVAELTRPQRAMLNAAAAGQNAIATRFEKIEQGMDRLAQELTEQKAENADSVADAVELARRLAIAAKMHETAHDLSDNRVGEALARETRIAQDIEQVLNTLRGEDERRPEQLADKLRQAEQRLEALRQQLATLRQQIAQSELQSALAQTRERLPALNQQQQELRGQIEQLARQLDRLQASDAEKSTRNAASRLDNRSQSEDQPPDNAGRPSSSDQVQKAEQDLENAARQLAERRQQAEDDLALEIVRRFQAELTEMVQRQRKVIDETMTLDRKRQSNDQLVKNDLDNISKLAAEERELAYLAKEHSEMLVGLGAVRVSLEEAERRLAAAARLLDERKTGQPAQHAERHALARLEGMMEAFAQTANEAAKNQNAPSEAGADGDQPQRRPTFELLEVKMLRMLQVDLHERTREYQQRLAGLDAPIDERHRAELQREAQDLAAEQGRLAELVQNMLTRDNEKGDP